MRRAILFLVPVLAACGGGVGEESGGRDSPAAVQTEDLTGLYEARGAGGHHSRMCMTPGPSGLAFGLVVETANGSCSGAGEAVRSDSLLRLTMTGDEQCVIEARIEETQVTFPSSVAEGCAYYCGPGASLAGHSLEKTGGTAQDATRATDLAGDPLCG